MTNWRKAGCHAVPKLGIWDYEPDVMNIIDILMCEFYKVVQERPQHTITTQITTTYTTTAYFQAKYKQTNYTITIQNNNIEIIKNYTRDMTNPDLHQQIPLEDPQLLQKIWQFIENK